MHGLATLREVEEDWSWADAADAHALLDAREAARELAEQQADARARMSRR